MPNYPPTTKITAPPDATTTTTVGVPHPLPKTGGNDNSIMIFGGGALLLGALVIAGARSRANR